MEAAASRAPSGAGRARTGLSRRPLVVASLASVVPVLLLAGLAASVAAEAGPAVAGALLGGAVALGCLLSGALVVRAVAGLVPTASLLVALLTYTLQVLALLLFLVAMRRSGLMDDEVSSPWLAGALVLVTLTWTFGTLWGATRERIPAFDEPRSGVNDQVRRGPEVEVS